MKCLHKYRGKGIKINNTVIIVGAAALLLLVVVYFLLRDTPEKNLRKASKYHKLGEMHFQKGNSEEARLNYEIAKTYREKALKQKGGK